eukprot:2912700-Rhodomonas_salina.1
MGRPGKVKIIDGKGSRGIARLAIGAQMEERLAERFSIHARAREKGRGRARSGWPPRGEGRGEGRHGRGPGEDACSGGGAGGGGGKGGGGGGEGGGLGREEGSDWAGPVGQRDLSAPPRFPSVPRRSAASSPDTSSSSSVQGKQVSAEAGCHCGDSEAVERMVALEGR